MVMVHEGMSHDFLRGVSFEGFNEFAWLWVPEALLQDGGHD